MRPKAKAIGLVSIVPVGRKDIHFYTNSERNHCLIRKKVDSFRYINFIRNYVKKESSALQLSI
jgi:hypothetical protein